MSDTRDPDTDQPAPVPNNRPCVQDLLVADIQTRKAHGIRKYGMPLHAGNGRDMLLDAYEEALDLAVYLRGALEERTADVVSQLEPGALRAPDADLVTRVAGAMCEAWHGPGSWPRLGGNGDLWPQLARVALAVARPAMRSEAMWEAAEAVYRLAERAEQ